MNASPTDVAAVRKGFLAMIACCAIWGLSPLYYRMLSHVSPEDILAHRVIWSLFFFLGLLILQARAGRVIEAVTDRRQVGWILLAALLVSVNWGVFILSIQIGRLTEASLGYYILPLVSVLFGLVLFRERLTVLQWIAVCLAALAVAVLTLGLGAAPWISLLLATTFGTYGVLKKRVLSGPVVSVTAEVLLLAPFAALWLVAFAETGWPDNATLVLLVLSGPLTAGPLILFSYAAKRVRLATLGLIQYLNPSLQFLLASAVFGEPIGLAHAIAFPMIWLALALYSWVTLSSDRAERRAATSAATVGTT